MRQLRVVRGPEREPPCAAALILCGALAVGCGGPDREAPDRAPRPPPGPAVQEGPGFYQELSWAPDGGSLLVSVLEITDEEPGFEYRIWSVDADGGRARPMSPGPRDYWTSWSPDGRRVVFAGSEGGAPLDVFTMNADGSERRRLTVTEWNDTQPAWSPDGERIAFVSDREGRAQLWIMSADGSGARRLLESAGEVQNPAWSPDGRRIAFYETDGAGNDRVTVVGADGSDPTALVEGLWPVWTPDGMGLLFGGDGGLYRLRLEGGEPTLVIAGDVLAGELSPDGDRLAYILEDGGSVALVVSDPDGSEAKVLMTRPRPDW